MEVASSQRRRLERMRKPLENRGGSLKLYNCTIMMSDGNLAIITFLVLTGDVAGFSGSRPISFDVEWYNSRAERSSSTESR